MSHAWTAADKRRWTRLTITAAAAIRSAERNDRPHLLAEALADLGRVCRVTYGASYPSHDEGDWRTLAAFLHAAEDVSTGVIRHPSLLAPKLAAAQRALGLSPATKASAAPPAVRPARQSTPPADPYYLRD